MTHKTAKQVDWLFEPDVVLPSQFFGTIRRQALATIKQPAQVKVLFDEIAPGFAGRAGGYTRITKLGPRMSDSSEMVILEWMEASEPVESKK